MCFYCLLFVNRSATASGMNKENTYLLTYLSSAKLWLSSLAALTTSPDLLSPASVAPVSYPLPRVFPPSISFLDVPFSFFPLHMPASSPSPDHLLSSHVQRTSSSVSSLSLSVTYFLLVVLPFVVYYRPTHLFFFLSMVPSVASSKSTFPMLQFAFP